MKFDHVIIQNFGPIAEAEVSLHDRGLVLIQGQNDTSTSAKSNGAGKSTLVDAISWCLFGKTAKGQTADAVINHDAGKDCHVQLQLREDDGTTYTITRGRKSKKWKSKLHVQVETSPGGISDLTKGTDRLTQEMVEKIIGCPYEVFVGAVYAGQERMPDLPSMTDKQLKLLIEEAAGITLLEDAHKIARDKASVAKNDLAEAERQLEVVETSAMALSKRLDDAVNAEKIWESERDARVIDLQTNARTLVTDAQALAEQIASMPNEDVLSEALEDVKGKIAGVKSEQERLQDLQGDARKAEGIVEVKKTEAKAILERTKSAGEELRRLKDEIGKPCETCGRAHDEDSLKSAIESQTKKVLEGKKLATDAVQVIKDVSSEALRARESASKYRDSMTDMSEAIARSETLTAQLSSVRSHKRELESLKKRAKEAVERVKVEKSAENPYTKKVADRRSEYSEKTAELATVKAAVPKARKACQIANDVVALYGAKGVRAHILDTVTPFLNARTAHYLGALADGEFQAVWNTLTINGKGEARENFNIEVTDASGKGSFADLSGGEKRKVRIASALALQDLVATRATKAIDLFIADEIDAALDEAALERLMGVLNEKALERGSVFIISHSDLKEWVSNHITVIKEGGKSRVKEMAA